MIVTRARIGLSMVASIVYSLAARATDGHALTGLSEARVDEPAAGAGAPTP
jgi:hypothetical protein